MTVTINPNAVKSNPTDTNGGGTPEVSDSRILGTLLTGLSTAVSGAISATDSIITALAKLQASKQDNLPTDGTSGKFLAHDFTWKTPPAGGGGGNPINVIEYDPADSTHQISTSITLSDAEVINNSTALVNGVLSPNTPLSLPCTYLNLGAFTLEFALAKIPLSSAMDFTVDFSNIDLSVVDTQFGVFGIPSSVDYETYINNVLGFDSPSVFEYNHFNTYFYIVDGNIESLDAVSVAYDNGTKQDVSTRNSLAISAFSQDKILKFKAVPTWQYYAQLINVNTYEDVVAQLTAMGIPESEHTGFLAGSILLISDSQSQEVAAIRLLNFKGDYSLYFYIASTALTTQNIALNIIDNKAVSNILPSNVSDGDYLHVLQSCKLLDRNIAAKDFIRLYDNCTKAILIKQ